MKVVSIAILCAATAGLASPAIADEETCQALFVHTAADVAYDGDSITMKNASPMVTFFCDRPVRLAGHLTVGSFLETVSEGEDPFSANPPNAVLSVVSGSDKPVDLVVTLNSRPEVEGNTLTYKDITVLEGNNTAVSGSGTLFIDHFGHPMSPGSVAGVHRRHKKRAVRSCEGVDPGLNPPGIDCNCGPGLVCH
ncbi:MAG: hypothetical protein ABJI96_16880 [Paracoccaceae bacterium]